MDCPLVDLFAASLNAQIFSYMSPFPDSQALAVDALSQYWTEMFAYAFPLTNLIQLVLKKVKDQVCKILLIAPFWPKRIWFVNLDFLVDFPLLLLPVYQDLLS